MSRSPIQALVSEGLDGVSTIRIFDQSAAFIGRLRTAVNGNSSALLNFVSAQRWLGYRIELMGSIVVLASSLLVISMNDLFKIHAGLVGLLILWSSHFTITLNFLVDTFSEAEASITAIERVDAMASLPQEADKNSPTGKDVPKDWPDQGRLEFDKVKLRYREGLPLALNGVSFTVPAGKRCGIVGRTGKNNSFLLLKLLIIISLLKHRRRQE